MPTYSASQVISAPASTAWRYISDVTEWPTWLPTVLHVQALTSNSLAVGARFKIVQPKLRPVVWSVIELNPERNFVWQSSNLGLTLWANHTITEQPNGGSKVLLEFRFSGILAPLVALIAGPITRRYLATEALSLKARAESTARGEV